jgi:hypothetical protein
MIYWIWKLENDSLNFKIRGAYMSVQKYFSRVIRSKFISSWLVSEWEIRN